MPSSEAFEKAVEAALSATRELRLSYPIDEPPLAREEAEAAVRAALPHLQAVQTGGEGLSKDTLEIACNCIGHTYRIEPDDHPDPNGATKAWRELRSAIRLIDNPPPIHPASTEGDLREAFRQELKQLEEEDENLKPGVGWTVDRKLALAAFDAAVATQEESP